MSSPHLQDHLTARGSEQVPNELDQAAEVEDGAEDPERIGLLAGHARILDRKPTSVELRLAILAFCFLCVASIGFGLFAGELANLHRTIPPDNRNPPIKIITTTVFLSPTNVPSPPKKPKDICSSGPCVDAAAELRRTTQFSVDPCENFAKFSTAGVRPPASEAISARIDSTIEHILSGPRSTDPTLSKIQGFKYLCEREGSQPAYSEYSMLLTALTKIWKRKAGSEADRLGAALAYLHAASLPALFKISKFTSNELILRPQTISVEGLTEAFEAIYPTDQVPQRIQDAHRVAATLSRLASHLGETKRLTLDQLQALTCSASPSPCWISWKDYYSALDPDKPISHLTVHGIDYFAHMARAMAEQSEIGLESYFHWVIISSLRRDDCQRETKLVFGPSLLKNLFFNTSEQLNDLHAHLRSARFILQTMLDGTHDENLPRTIEGPSTELDQSAELSAIRLDNWVETLYGLEKIKSRREFSEGLLRWNVLDSHPMVMGSRVYLPMGALQMPQSYPSSVDLPKSLLFGSLGYIMFDELSRMHFNGTMMNMADRKKTCEKSLSGSFAGWKAYAAGHPRDSRARLVGFPDDIGGPDQLFFLAYGSLGLSCPGLQHLPQFNNAFNCSSATPF